MESSILLSLLLVGCSFLFADALYGSGSDTFDQNLQSNWTQDSLSLWGRTGNLIDDCWRCDPNWKNNRKRLAECAVGFGSNAIGGMNGNIYVVTDPSDDDAVNPKPGTLRYGVIQSEPLWIIFERDMSIRLSEELMVNSYKTIDGRGVNVEIADGPCITVQGVSHVIIHGLTIHDCKPGGPGLVRDSPTHFGSRLRTDGDGITIYASNNIWVDHCTLYSCTDGLIDVTVGSTAVTVSNCHFSNHDKVMLLGHSDSYTDDINMQVTVVYNHFGEGCIERMPRCRHGNFHVVNNNYKHWEMYAIGGSANPTINAEGNRFEASDSTNTKEVTKREATPEQVWRSWNWRSRGNIFLNGAYFVHSGPQLNTAGTYERTWSVKAKPARLVEQLTAFAGALACGRGLIC